MTNIPADAHPQGLDVVVSNVKFSNGNKAILARVHPQSNILEVVEKLKLGETKALIMVFGGAGKFDTTLENHLFQLFSRGVVPAALESKAVIIDGGTSVGVMKVMGESVADRGENITLLGVVPSEKVTWPDKEAPTNAGSALHQLEPNHTHFMVVEGKDWTNKIGKLTELSSTLISKTRKVVTILINGGDVAKTEVLKAVRKGWSVVVLKGSGRLADDLAQYREERDKSKLEGKPLPFIPDAALAEIVADGDLHFFPIENEPEEFQRLLISQLSMENVLLQGWRQYKLYSVNAGRYQNKFKRIQKLILMLGVLSTTLAVTQSLVKSTPMELPFMTIKLEDILYITIRLEDILFISLLITPILIGILIAGSNRFDWGNKWIMLRAGSEAIKKELFAYRTKTGIYTDLETIKTGQSRSSRLAEMLGLISKQWEEGDVGTLAFHNYDEFKQAEPKEKKFGEIRDDSLSVLSPKTYLTIRLEDQLFNYYRPNAKKLERKLVILQWLTIILSGIGTFLVAIKGEIFIAFTTTIASALITYLEYNRTAETIRQYNQSASTLTKIRNWWLGFTPEEQAKGVNIDKLIELTEAALESEHTGWIQQMQVALKTLKEKETKSEEPPAQP
jgi:hypothetical protein